MGAFYDLPMVAIAATLQQDLWEILSPATKSIKVHRIQLHQSNRTTSEQLRISVRKVTGAPTSGSSGGTITPAPKSSLFADPAMTVERNNTTRLSGGTQISFPDLPMNIVGQGLDYVPSREGSPIECAGNERIVIGLETTPGASTIFSGNVEIEVVG